MKLPASLVSIRTRLLLVSLLLLLIPIMGFSFVREMERYLREGQQQVLVSAARLLSATLSDRSILTEPGPREEGNGEHRLLALFRSSDPATAADLGAAYQPSEDIERILGIVAKSASRVWVVDSRSNVRGLVGNLNIGDTEAVSRIQGLHARAVRPILRMLTASPAPATNTEGQTLDTSIFRQLDRALIGQQTVDWRTASDGSTLILSAAQPIWVGENIVGAVLIEENNGRVQSVTYAALETLLAISLVVFLVGFMALMAFAWRLAYRVRRLQIEADRAIDSQGRIQGTISASSSRDEVGALAKTLEEVLARLGTYNDYLEKMAGRLSHELRTPVAVVRSSLDNLRQSEILPAQQIYVERAEEGVSRLATLISRLSEATQLERMLQGAEREQFDIAQVVSGCVEGYRLAYPEYQFALQMNTASQTINGVPDAISQLLDKLVQNSIDFAVPGTPIRISLTANARQVILGVENDGPPLPAGTEAQLFSSMTSARPATTAHESHLGLGLYIVRLIAEFHHATVDARNLAEARGVRFQVSFPLLRV